MNTKRIFFLGLMLTFFFSSCQNDAIAQSSGNENGGLQVSGVGQMSVLPDLMETYINVQAEAKEFQEAVTSLRGMTDGIVKHLEDNGFKQDDIETLRMSVNKNYEYRDGRRIDMGYIATQRIQLTSDYSAKKLGEVVDIMGKSPVEVPFSFGFTLKDESREKYREELIGMAVKDARSKADVLAKAAGVKLRSIRNISYGNANDYRPIMRTEMAMYDAAGKNEGNVNLEVEEMELEERVNVEWIIND
ncbi:SIMPL domain-containing protein [Roseivirga sp. BDSF3-8]|uniref:SIMPL domain-containing protein n=1 Tax=Roseivirga sp. BDSF3-8 TaxID=3241598 RepID=UPI0035321CD2